MKKDFDSWNIKKKETNGRSIGPYYHQRELWWCTLGANIGSEQDGSGREYRRPVLILRGFSIETCLIVPLTTSTRPHPLRPCIGDVDGKRAHALLSQIRVVDAKRLVRKIGHLDGKVFTNIRKAAREML